MTCLPDVNVWVALAVEQHVHHARAKAWFLEAAKVRIAFCRVTQMGLLRLLTNSKVMGADVLNGNRAWDVFDSFSRDSRISFAPEPEEVKVVLREFTCGRKAGANVWTDAYLAGFARCNGWRLITFDQGFRRYGELRVTVLG